jgi:hypothetical protein
MRPNEWSDGALVLEGSRVGALRMIGYLAMVGAFEVHQLLLLWDPTNTTRIAMYGALLLLVALGVAHFAYQVVRPRTVVVVDALGIVDHASAGGAGRVFWKEIASAHIYQFAQFRTLRIVPRDLDAIARRQPGWKRCYYRTLWRFGSPPINIPQELVPVPLDYLLAIITERVERIGRP